MRTRWVVASWLKQTLAWAAATIWFGGGFVVLCQFPRVHGSSQIPTWVVLAYLAPFELGILAILSLLAILVLAGCWDAIEKQGSPIKRVTEPVLEDLRENQKMEPNRSQGRWVKGSDPYGDTEY